MAQLESDPTIKQKADAPPSMDSRISVLDPRFAPFKPTYTFPANPPSCSEPRQRFFSPLLSTPTSVDAQGVGSAVNSAFDLATSSAAWREMRAIEFQGLEIARIARVNLFAMEERYSKVQVINSIDLVAAANIYIQNSCSTLQVPAKLDTFFLFRKLPVEICLKIWRCMMPGPRYVPVVYKQDTVYGISTRNTPWGIWGCDQLSPIVLQVCKESRTEGLRKYKLRLDTLTRDCYVRIDPNEDTVLLLGSRREGLRGSRALNSSELLFNGVLKLEALQSIKNLAIDLKTLNPSTSLGFGWPVPLLTEASRHRFEEFTALENLELVGSHRVDHQRQRLETQQSLCLGELRSTINELDEDEPHFDNYNFVVAGLKLHGDLHPGYTPPNVSFVSISY